MIDPKSQLLKLVSEYLLEDYEFLADYEVIETDRVNQYSFVAKIRNSQQKVRFIKKPFSRETLPRFKVLHNLYRRGVILADNMFILQESEQYFFYVIEAEVDTSGRFTNLQQYLHVQANRQQVKQFVTKIKILLDCLHQEGQGFGGLDPRNIIIDDQKHLYLAPYSLDYQMKSDCCSRAYYPPELLLKMQKSDQQVSEENILKWDIWAYGCIALELLLYDSPLFLSTSLQKQLKAINCYSLSQLEEIQQKSIKNMLHNSLKTNFNQRSLSIEQKTIQNNQTAVHAIKTGNQQDFMDSRACKLLRQLNLHNSSEGGDCRLSIQLLSLINPCFEKELRVTIKIQKEFHFYLNFNENNPKYYSLNRKITTKGTFSQLENLLQKPITVILQEASVSALIKVNLQSLVLTHEGKRVWEKQLIGTYKATQPYKNTTLKVKCSLYCQNPIQQQKTEPVKIKQVKVSSVEVQEKMNQRPILAQKTNKLSNIDRQNDQKGKEKRKIPSISQISEGISELTQQLKLKLKGDQEQTDCIQTRLRQLMDIQ